MLVIIIVTLQVAGCSLDRYLLIDSGTYSLVAYPEKKEGSPPPMLVGLKISREEGLVDFILRKGENITIPYTVREKRLWLSRCTGNLFSFKTEVIDLIPNKHVASILGFDHPVLVRNCPEEPYQLVLSVNGEIGGSSNGCLFTKECLIFNPAQNTVDHPYQDLELMLEELERKKSDIESWAETLVDGYGPGIWYFSSSERPLFHHAPESLTLEAIVEELNELLKTDQIPTIRKEGLTGTTVQLSVSDDHKLAQGMGSSGAQSYLQVVLYSLASLPEINCVDFQFQEGDHSQPGLVCRPGRDRKE